MNNKKYEILMDEENTIEWKGHTLHRIRALRDFGDIRKGDIGGFVENENNLSHKGNCWIYDDAKAMDNSIMYDNSRICDKSELHDDSEMYGDSELNNQVKLYGKLFSKVDEFIEIQNPEGRIVTCIRRGDKVLYNVGCQREITEETFRWRIENEDGGIKKHPYKKYYYKIIEMAKLYFDIK